MPVSAFGGMSCYAAMARLQQRLRDFRALTFKHEATPLTAFFGTIVVLGGLSVAQSTARVLGASDAMLAVGSFASVCTLLLRPIVIRPQIPMAKTMLKALKTMFCYTQSMESLLKNTDSL